MAGNVVNLRQARKQRTRAEKHQRAEENRVKYGRSKAERARQQLQERRTEDHLDGHRLDSGEPGDC